MDARLSEDQILLRESARDFLSNECAIEYVRSVMESDEAATDSLWNKMVSLGWMGLALPEHFGGAGMDLVDQTIVLEEMGRALAPAPYLSSAVLGGTALLVAGSDRQQTSYLPKIAGGLRVALAMLEDSGSWSAESIAMPARAEADGFRIDGTKHFVLDAAEANLFLVPVRAETNPAGVTLLLVERNAPGVEVREVAYTDQTRGVAMVDFRATPSADDGVLASVGGGYAALEHILDAGRVALCAEMVGGAQRVLELSTEYARTREQFGRPIGSFQAIQHKCADMLVRIEAARSATWYAAWAVANKEPDAHLSACLAKAYCSDAYTAVASQGIQVHGGLGFTWEHDPHLYFKRAVASALFLGDATWHRELAARELLATP